MKPREREFPEGSDATPGAAGHLRKGRKLYTGPEIIEWGHIREITLGLKAGIEDFPLKGGSKGV